MSKSEYMRGYIDGRKEARRIIEEDVKYITACDAKVLHKHGNTQEEIAQFIADVQEEWQDMRDKGVTDLDRYLLEEIGFTIFQDKETYEKETQG